MISIYGRRKTRERERGCGVAFTSPEGLYHDAVYAHVYATQTHANVMCIYIYISRVYIAVRDAKIFAGPSGDPQKQQCQLARRGLQSFE